MEATGSFNQTIKTKHIIYGVLYVFAFSWPWVWMAATGSSGEGDLVDIIVLGTIPAIIISVFIVYRETKLHPAAYKWAFAVALGAAFILVWLTGAVGIIGRSGDPADLLFFGVLVVGIIGALISHFRPLGMAFTLVAMAVAQMLASVIELITGWGSIIILNGFFAVLWLVSALLFRYAAHAESEIDNR